MFTLSVSLEVNPEGAAPQLTAHQVWQGLVMKAENALPFVPGIERCDLLEKGEGWLLREIEIGGKTAYRSVYRRHLFQHNQTGFRRKGPQQRLDRTRDVRICLPSVRRSRI